MIKKIYLHEKKRIKLLRRNIFHQSKLYFLFNASHYFLTKAFFFIAVILF